MNKFTFTLFGKEWDLGNPDEQKQLLNKIKPKSEEAEALGEFLAKPNMDHNYKEKRISVYRLISGLTEDESVSANLAARILLENPSAYGLDRSVRVSLLEYLIKFGSNEEIDLIREFDRRLHLISPWEDEPHSIHNDGDVITAEQYRSLDEVAIAKAINAIERHRQS